MCVCVCVSPQKESGKCILITNELLYCSLDTPAGWKIINFVPDWLTGFVMCQVFAKHIQYPGDVIFLCTTWGNISGQCSSVTGHVQWKMCWNMERSEWNNFSISYNEWLAAISNEHSATSNFLSSKSSLHCTSNKCAHACARARAHTHTHIYRVSQEEGTKLRESVPYVKIYWYNPKHLHPKLNGYGDNGQRSLQVWQLLHTYWLSNSY